jgi:hypothetical protein
MIILLDTKSFTIWNFDICWGANHFCDDETVVVMNKNSKKYLIDIQYEVRPIYELQYDFKTCYNKYVITIYA